MAGIILVADDEGLSQRLVSAVIQYCGFEGKITSNGLELLDELRGGLVPELILLDLEMPVMGGIEVLKHLSVVPPEERCPIIVFTSHHSETTVREAAMLGADDFVVKPFKSHDLAHRIKDLTLGVEESEITSLLTQIDGSVAQKTEFSTLRKKLGPRFEVFSLNLEGQKMCVSVPRGETPESLAALSLRELRAKVAFYREGGSGWKKVWPRPGRNLAGSLASAS